MAKSNNNGWALDPVFRSQLLRNHLRISGGRDPFAPHVIADVVQRGKRGVCNLKPLECSQGNPKRGFWSAKQVDQERRNQNRNKRPRSIEAKESGEDQRDDDVAHCKVCFLSDG